MPPSLPPKAIFRQDQDKLWWSKKASDFARHSPTLRDEVGEHPANWRVGSFACLKPCCFLCLITKKVTKENSRLQRILGLLFFSLPAQYTRRLRQLADPPQTVLLTTGPHSKLQNSRFFPKFSEAILNPKTFTI